MIDALRLLTGCGASSGVELHGVEAEPWVFKGGLSGEVQVGMTYLMIQFKKKL